MGINIYDFHDIIRETYIDYVSRYDVDLIEFKNELGPDSEPLFIEHQRLYLEKMREFIIDNINKIKKNDLDTQFYHDKLQEALSENKNMFYFLNIKSNPLLSIPEAKNETLIDDKSLYPSKIFRDRDSFKKFQSYIENHIIDFYTDYSYLKKRMELEAFIMRTTDSEFVNFLSENNYITSKNYDEYLINGKLKTLKKSFTANRENNFNNIFFK
jgi:hypothetical protein